MTNTLALIPARAGSKGLPGKNSRLLNGVPLLAHTVRAAKHAPAVTRTVVSTDGEDLAAIAREFGAEVPCLRPDALAGDSAQVIDTIDHTLNVLRPWVPDVVILLQPTSPLRNSEHIAEALALLFSDPMAGAVISITQAKPAAWLLEQKPLNLITPWLGVGSSAGNRQDHPPLWLPNGAIYAAHTPYLRTHRGFLGPATLGYRMSPETSVDIDNEYDFLVAEVLSSAVEKAKRSSCGH